MAEPHGTAENGSICPQKPHGLVYTRSSKFEIDAKYVIANL
jgi:hypothetical protein